MQASPAT